MEFEEGEILKVWSVLRDEWIEVVYIRPSTEAQTHLCHDGKNNSWNLLKKVAKTGKKIYNKDMQGNQGDQREQRGEQKKPPVIGSPEWESLVKEERERKARRKKG